MIVYTNTKDGFRDDVRNNVIADEIKKQIQAKHINAGGDSEFRSWQNSMHFMSDVLDDSRVPNANIAIEYQIPRLEKRIDFIISGRDSTDAENLVVVELKQWEKARKIDDVSEHCVSVDFQVQTFLGGGERQVPHPSYQALSYTQYLADASAVIQNEGIKLIPCAYLHNYEDNYVGELSDPIYEPVIKRAPFYVKSQTKEFREFILKHITKKTADNQLLWRIDHGEIRPSKALQDAISSVLAGNQEFILLDEQIVCFDYCVRTMKQCLEDGKKRTLIIEGGPGTGKSVLAINLLQKFISQGLNAVYCTKNSAPRNNYQSLLTAHSDLDKRIKVEALFHSANKMCKSSCNFYKCLIIDEAHRLVKYFGINQIKKAIDSALLSIFFIDESQRVTKRDIGSVAEIEKWCKELGSECIRNDDLVLKAQYRCNGSDEYLQLIDNILQYAEYYNIDSSQLKYDFRLYDDPNKMRDELRNLNSNNKARMVAGYCYDWNSKEGDGADRDKWDIILENDFKAKWNSYSPKSTWATDPNSFEQVGCIHTAQGMEFDYVGVIIGKDLRYDANKKEVICDKNAISKDDNSSWIRACKDDAKAAQLIKNTYRTLLTRGQKGCFIYCEDKALLNYISSISGQPIIR